MKKLPNKINETFEEGYKRKSKVLDEIYTNMQKAQKIQPFSNEIIDTIIKLVEDFNIKSIKEN